MRHSPDCNPAHCPENPCEAASLPADPNPAKPLYPVRGDELWTYAGNVLLSSGKLGDLWLDPDNTRLFFKKGSSKLVGGIYKVDVERHDAENKRMTMHGDPEWTGDKVERDRQMQLEAVSRTEKARHRAAREHAAAKRVSASLEALEPIRRAYWSTNAEGQRAILAELIRAVTAPLPIKDRKK
jgi:hypothetical protein